MKTSVPKQKTGGFSDTVSERLFPTEKQADKHFRLAYQRLLSINDWHKIVGKGKVKFSLVNKSGQVLRRLPALGDFIKISMPGPDNETGKGFDWVVVEDIQESKKTHEESIDIKVRPTSSPINEEATTAHFFNNLATINFIVKRESNKVIAEVHGRNEKPNLESSGIFQKIRNLLIALGGIFGGSKIQWKSLTDGLIE